MPNRSSNMLLSFLRDERRLRWEDLPVIVLHFLLRMIADKVIMENAGDALGELHARQVNRRNTGNTN